MKVYAVFAEGYIGEDATILSLHWTCSGANDAIKEHAEERDELGIRVWTEGFYVTSFEVEGQMPNVPDEK